MGGEGCVVSIYINPWQEFGADGSPAFPTLPLAAPLGRPHPGSCLETGYFALEMGRNWGWSCGGTRNRLGDVSVGF